jgi:DnaJ-domain-containing protein 1
MSYVALASKLIQCDRPINEIELETLIASFAVTDDYRKKIIDLLLLANKDNSSLEYYADIIYRIFHNNNRLLQELINNLVKIAVYDDFLTNSETECLNRIARVFGILPYKVSELINYHLAIENFEVNKILGIGKKKFSLEILNKNYRDYANIYHPDKLNMLNLSSEYLHHINKRFITLTKSYQDFKKILKKH